MAQPKNFDQRGRNFVQNYYKWFDNAAERPNLIKCYRDQSMLSFEGAPYESGAKIVEKLFSLPFEQIEHRVDTIDCQPTPNDGTLVMVTGALLTSGETKPIQFSQTFQVFDDETGAEWALNDVFRLVYG